MYRYKCDLEIREGKDQPQELPKQHDNKGKTVGTLLHLTKPILGSGKLVVLDSGLWVFKIKKDGTYRARLVVLGYSQIPGVDYTDNFAPVAHDVTFRIALARMMVEKLDSLVMDVETAFLYREIDEESS